MIENKKGTTMNYPRADRMNPDLIKHNIMGPNPAKLLEEMLNKFPLEPGQTVMDLGCGQGVTSIMLVKEYGLKVFAVDLWISASENWQRFRKEGLTREQIVPIHEDAHQLPFADEFFDAVVSIDSYHYFGLDKAYLGKHLLPLVKPGGYLLLVVPGFHRDVHANIPKELLLTWSAEDLDTIHDADYWRDVISATDGVEILAIDEMESNENCWEDWLATDNEYAVMDRAPMNAGAGKYMNFVAIALKKM
jgi:cyclopropane fatty-acyl-phospholipid synthase-like methyltransferase